MCHWEALLGRWHSTCQDLPGAELPPPVLTGCPSSVSPQGHVEPALEDTNFHLFLGKGAGAGGYCISCAPGPSAASPSWCHYPVTPHLPKVQPSPGQDDAPSRARRGLNVFSRWKTNNAMHSSAQHPQKVAPHQPGTWIPPSTASHTHRGILILGSHSLFQLRKNASMPSPGAGDAHLLPPYLPCWLQAACSCHVIFSTLSTDGNLQCVMSCWASSQLTSTFSRFKEINKSK